jgi:hypothetical protein
LVYHRSLQCAPEAVFVISKAKQNRQQTLPVLPARRHRPDGLDARLPFRWPQDETEKSPAFIISIVSG